jgi:hypothetical protein
MTLRKSWLVASSNPAAGANALDGRLAQAGLYARSSAGVVRAGVLGVRVGIVTARSDMALDIDAFEAVLSRSKTYGVTPIANDGLVSVELPAAPSSNSRWVRVYVKQNDNIDAADADNAPVLGVVSGAAAAAPTLPALPTGALPIARILQPANVLGTADCTVIEDFPMTAPLGGVVPVRDATERGNWAPDDGGLAFQLDADILWVRKAGGWWEEFNDSGWITAGTGGSTLVAGWTAAASSGYPAAAFRYIGGVVHLRGVAVKDSEAGPIAANDGAFILPAAFRPSTSREVTVLQGSDIKGARVNADGVLRILAAGQGSIVLIGSYAI